MLPKEISHDKVDAIRALVESAHKIVIICHMTPDGDAMGASLALCDVLLQLGKNAFVVTPDMPPKNLQFLPGASSVVVGSRSPEKAHNLLTSADLIFCLDFNSIHRIDRLAPYLANAAGKKIVVDHHLDPESFADVIVSSPESSSTCALLYLLLSQLGLAAVMSKDAAH